ncbi:serendipity locus protein alpha [Culex quinquefasciatus]|uniref:Serendipity locus protein alpha n=1 Tax=Culex quinquefasciatus TaxID=7176 RepID=B0W8C8_CULQU|nr:serendipity locus protein alpha [Culex quinquefasciatus]|eukprot:XP_001844962.1 serendipity locus protein alpha [Culex quinquefasciatus]
MEMSFLCLSQIVVCIRYLERTLIAEQENQCSTRQFFLDRIVWCISKIKTLAEDSSLQQESSTESNFVSFLDLALNLVGPMTIGFDDNGQDINRAEQDAEAMMESARIRSVVEALITQTFAFGNVLEDDDRAQLTTVCQKVLKECIALEKESALVEGEGRPDAQSRRLRASVLEAVIYQLESQVNDCLLKLVYETFAELDQNVIREMRRLVKEEASEEQIDGMANRFDAMVDKIMQIGLFAISYADNYKAASTIRSCLASVEALDSYLIPSIYVPCNHHSNLLEAHWLEESSLLRYHVQRIIDSNAFSSALIEILDSGIDHLNDSFEPMEATKLLAKAEVFRQHLEFNGSELCLFQEPLKIHFEDFKMMLLECKAILRCSVEDRTIATDRILKRFRILLTKLRKIQLAVGKSKEPTKDVDADHKPALPLPQTDEEKEVDRSVQEFFSTSVVRPSATSILYQSRRGPPGTARRNTTASPSLLLDVNSYSDVTAELRQRAETTPEKSAGRKGKKPVVKRNSLRVAMFKRVQCRETAEFFESFKSDMELQITEILDELTDLSSTFSPSEQMKVEPGDAEAKVENSEQVVESTTPSNRKSITKEEIAISKDNRITINITTDI